jgi:serine/threonine-protein kinase SRPK3
MMELLGPMPKNFAIPGKNFDNFFTKEGSLNNKYSFRRIKGLRYVPLKKLLIEKYKLKVKEAEMLADFLLTMLKWYPRDRASARDMLEHPWLKMADDYNYRMTDLEYKKYTLKSTIDTVKD